MSYGIVPYYSDDNMVCRSICRYKDCAVASLPWSNVFCPICNKPILVGETFYRKHYCSNVIFHAACKYKKWHRL